MHTLLAEAEYPIAPLDLQMQIGWLLLLCLTLLALWAWTRAESLRRALFAREDPRLFGLFRIGLGLITIQNFWNLNMHWRMLWTDEGMFTAAEAQSRLGRAALTGWTELDGFFDHWALLKFFWGKYSLLYIHSSPSFVLGYLVVLYLVLVLFTLGVRTHVTGVVGMLLVNSLYNRNAVYLEGHDTVFRCMWFMVLFARADAAWSVDNWIRMRREAKLRAQLAPSREGPTSVPFDWRHWLDRSSHWLYGGMWAAAFCVTVDFPLWSTAAVVLAGLTYNLFLGLSEQAQRRTAAQQGTLELPEPVRFRLIPAWPRWLFIIQLMLLYSSTGLYKTGSVWSKGDALYYALNMDHFFRFEVVTQWVSVYLATNVFRVFTWVTLYWEKLFPLVAIGLMLRWRELHRDAPWYRAMQRVWWRMWLGRIALVAVYAVVYRLTVLAYPWCLELQKDKSPTPAEPGLAVIHTLFAVVLPLLTVAWLLLGRWPIKVRGFCFDQVFVRKWVFGRRIWLGIGVLFHGMLIVTMNIGMFPVIMMWFYPAFFEARPFLIMGRWLRDRWRRRKLTSYLAPKLLDDALSEQPGILESSAQSLRRDPTGPWWLDPWKVFYGGYATLRAMLTRGRASAWLDTLARGRTRGGRIPDTVVFVVLAVGVSLAALRGLEADPEGSARGTTATFVSDVRTLDPEREAQREQILERKQRIERIADATHWWVYTALALALISHLRRRPPEDQLEGEGADASKLAEPQLIGGTLVRTLVLGFVVFHNGAIMATFIPRYSITQAWRTEVARVFGDYMSGTNLSQSWKMFAPNPPRGNTFMRTVVVDHDGSPYHVGNDHYAGRPFVFWYNDRERKMHRRMIGKSKWYLQYWGDYHCRGWALANGGQMPKEVRMFRLSTGIPTPEELSKSGVASNPRTRKLKTELVETHSCNDDALFLEMKLRHGWTSEEEVAAELEAQAQQLELGAAAKRKQWDARKDFGGKGEGRPTINATEAVEQDD